MAVQIKNPLTGGGGAGGSLEVVNGIIEQYKAASGTIDANTFVEFVNGYLPPIERFATGWSRPSATLLDEANVFITYYHSDIIYGVIVTINDDSAIVSVSPVRLVNYAVNTSHGTHVVSLSSNKVLVAFNANSNNSVVAFVATIDNGTISAGTSTVSNITVMNLNSLASISANKVVASGYRSTTSTYVNTLVVISVSGDSVSFGSTTLAGGDSSVADIAVIDTDKFYFSYSGSSSLLGVVCSISGATVSIGTVTTISPDQYAGYSSRAVALSSSSVFVSHSFGQTFYYLNGVATTVDGASITVGTDTRLDSTAYTASSAAPSCKFDESTVCVFYSSSEYGWAGRMAICEVEGGGTTLQRLEQRTPAQYRIGHPFRVSDGKVFCLYLTTNATLGCLVDRYMPDYILAGYDVDKLSGLTKTACTADTPGDVWVLNASSTTN